MADVVIAPDFAAITDYDLSVYAAVIMWGEPLATWRDGSPMWEPKNRPFGRYVPKHPNGDIESFRPDTDERHAAEFRDFVLNIADMTELGANFMPQVVYAQMPQMSGEHVHPRPQVRFWHSKIYTSAVKADKRSTMGELFECIDRSQPRADTIALCKLMDWLLL